MFVEAHRENAWFIDGLKLWAKKTIALENEGDG